jgi:hypothetical protein
MMEMGHAAQPLSLTAIFYLKNSLLRHLPKHVYRMINANPIYFAIIVQSVKKDHVSGISVNLITNNSSRGLSKINSCVKLPTQVNYTRGQVNILVEVKLLV